MLITLLSDIHGNIDKIEKISDELKKSDLIILSGDITHFGGEDDAKRVISQIAKHQSNILAVAGNCDYPEVEHYLSREGISIHLKSAIYNGIGFTGVGGSLPCPGRTPNELSEEEMEAYLVLAHASFYETIPFALIVHHPPFNTCIDRVKTGIHVGSVSIRQAIENLNPVFCVSGHIHEAKGKDQINTTVVINPGPFKEGNYVLVKMTDNNIDTVKLLMV